MKIQIRKSVFETNSSSTHAIAIEANNDTIYKNLPDVVIFDSGNFGWDRGTYTTVFSKASYLFEAILGCCCTDKNSKDSWRHSTTVSEAVQYITDVLAKYGVVAEFPYLYDVKTVDKSFTTYKGEKYEYTVTEYKNAEGKLHDGYIDHVCDTYDFVDAILKNEELLMRYLFGNSVIETGNDNDDHDIYYNAVKIFTNHEIFYKGN